MRTDVRRTPTILGTLLLVAFAAACDGDNPVALPQVPPAPQNVAATVNGDGTITVTWGAVTDATSYDVQRNRVEGSSGFQTVGDNVTATRYVDSDITPGSTYQYRLIAQNDAGTSGFSDIAQALVGAAVATLRGGVDDVGDGVTRTLSADTVYTLEGIVKVEAGGTLLIEAGTTILGSVDVAPTALFVLRGGRIDAQGVSDAPIVFTSARPVGSRAAGDWGGVVLHGYSICNFPDRPCIGEGGSGAYGPDEGQSPVLDDDSGIMTYVRIEFAGYEVSFGNELNALTMNGVGNGTTLQHIHTHRGLDDGFEWFGGTVDLKYALATQISDDSFDYSTGWQGRGQFWIAQQDPSDADRGFEVDGNEGDHAAAPLTDPMLYNVTLVGKAPGTGVAGESDDGILFRRGTAGELHNAIVLGFETGFDIDDAATAAHCASGALLVSASIFHDNGEFLDDDSDTYEPDCTAFAGWDLRQQDPQLADPYNLNAPDFTPASGSPATTDADAPPTDGWFDAVTYIGAADPGATSGWWTWTEFASN